MHLANLMKKSDAFGQRKHLPYIEVSPCGTCGELSVTVRVGKEIFHTSTEGHFYRAYCAATP